MPQGGSSDAADALGPLLERAKAHELAPAMERRVLLLHNMTPLFDEAKGGEGAEDRLWGGDEPRLLGVVDRQT